MQNSSIPVYDPEWKATLPDEHNITLDDLKFVFYQAEKRLDDGIKNYDATTSKSITFITLTATLLTALSAYFFSQFVPGGVFDPKLCTVFVCIIYTSILLARFVYIVLPKFYQPIGSYPQDLLVNSFFTDEIKTHKWGKENVPTLYLYFSEIESYNRRLIQNATVNDLRLHIFNQSAKLILAMPVLGLLAYASVLGVLRLVSPSL